MRIFVVLNPVAGRTQPGAVRDALRHYFSADSIQIDIYETTGEEDIAGLVGAAINEGVDQVFAAGGDGTVSAVVDSLVNSDIPLGIIPAGTSNVVAQELGIPLQIDRACKMLAGKTERRSIDAIRYGDHYYVLSVGTGLGALAIRDTSRAHKRRFGPLAYIWTILKLIIGIQPRTFTIIADGEEREFHAADVMLANSATLTIPIRRGAHIQPDDGRIDICIMRAQSVFDIFGVAWDILVPGRTRRNRNLVYWPAYQSVTVLADRAMPVQGDGELLGETPIEATIMASAVQVMVPTEQSHQFALKLPFSKK
jgi:diacylglycerol kinase (ATP)